MPELPAFLFLCLLWGLTLSRSSLLMDLDICWLVRTGQLLWQTGQLPREDVFSFTQAGRPWVLYQWGYEVILGGLYRLAGLGGVVWGAALLIAFTYALLLYAVLRLGTPRRFGLALVWLALWVGATYWHSRPHTGGFLIFLVVLLLLENHRRHPSSRPWMLPLLFCLWANLHLSFFFGLGVVLFYGLWECLAPLPVNPTGPRGAQGLKIFFFCLLATWLNPYGPSLMIYIWHLTRATNINNIIIEMASPNFHIINIFAPFVIQLALLLWLKDIKLNESKVLLVLLIILLSMALYSARHLTFFSLAATLYLARLSAARSGGEPHAAAGLFKGWGWAAAGIFISLLWVMVIQHWRPGYYHFPFKEVPAGATVYISRKASDSLRPLHIFSNNAQWHDYFIYRLYPRVRVFIDTRFDFYGDDFVKRYLELNKELSCRPSSLDAWRVDVVVLDKETWPVKCRLPSPWNQVYEDQQALIYWHDHSIIK